MDCLWVELKLIGFIVGVWWKSQRLASACKFVNLCVSLSQVVVDKVDHSWIMYDAGPRHVRSPLVCFPPVCGTADVFFKQLLDLSTAGYRVISVSASLSIYIYIY